VTLMYGQAVADVLFMAVLMLIPLTYQW
jgi:hypothetical protein